GNAESRTGKTGSLNQPGVPTTLTLTVCNNINKTNVTLFIAIYCLTFISNERFTGPICAQLTATKPDEQ
ncbi:hypothetical protein, partial [Enterobacter asburiae]|uniref:hypothetical protein n=1 Tax=Enterobacter asburiae TaxID=61645 RepID=UPI002074E9B1